MMRDPEGLNINIFCVEIGMELPLTLKNNCQIFLGKFGFIKTIYFDPRKSAFLDTQRPIFGENLSLKENYSM